MCGGVCQTPTYLSGKGKEACQREFEKQIEIFLKNDVDFLLAEVNLTFKGIFERYDCGFFNKKRITSRTINPLSSQLVN